MVAGTTVMLLLAVWTAGPARGAQGDTRQDPSSWPSWRLVGEPNKSIFLQLYTLDEHRLGRRLLRNATLDIQGTLGADSTTRTAVKLPSEGFYYTTLAVGTPRKPYTFQVDTGSSITFVTCAACKPKCGKHKAYEPRASSTAKRVPCKDVQCRCEGCSCPKTAPATCSYNSTYGDLSYTEGGMWSDLLTLPDKGPPIRIALGCSQFQNGTISTQNMDGIMGMGTAQGSLPLQLAASGKITPQFTLCYGFPSGGGLLLGPAKLPPSAKLTYIPYYPDVFGGMYNVSIENIHVDGVGDLAEPGVFDYYDEEFGAILDSGTTLTQVPTPALLSVVSALDLRLNGTRVRPVDFRMTAPYFCWNNVPATWPEVAKLFPSMHVRFANGAKWPLPPYRYLFRAGEPNFYCLGMMDAGEVPMIVMGAITMRNMLVQHDLVKKRIGFTDFNCAAV